MVYGPTYVNAHTKIEVNVCDILTEVIGTSIKTRFTYKSIKQQHNAKALLPSHDNRPAWYDSEEVNNQMER